MTEPVHKQSATLPGLPDLDPEKQQRRASDPALSVWVNASAGSGKTTVLTQRVIRLLLDGVKPEKILCLTYTRAAAAEMAIRITGQLGSWATCSDAELDRSLDKIQGHAPTNAQRIEARRLFAKILSCPGGMRIRTIHSFCQEILRRFPIEAGLPPHFAVIEENDAKALQEEVQRELLIEAQRQPDSLLARAFHDLVLSIGEYRFGDALGSVLQERPRLMTALAHAGGVEGLIAHLRAFLQLQPEDKPAFIRAQALREGAFAREELMQAALWLQEGSKAYAPRGTKLEKCMRMSGGDLSGLFDDYLRCFFTKDLEPYDKFANNDLLKKYPRLAEILERETRRLQAVLERLEVANIAEVTASLLIFGEAFLRKYEARKAAQAILDYDDLIIRTQSLLQKQGIAPWILFKLDGGIDHLLVDEAQDTSRSQWDIVAAIADEFFAGASAREDINRTLFVVGDEKQSIFSFQRADPESFRSMRHIFAQRIEDAKKDYDEVPMRTSFRSAPAILRAVDAVFAQAQIAEGVSQDRVQHFSAQPRMGEQPKAGHVEIWPLQAAPVKDKESDLWNAPLGYEPQQDEQAELAKQIAAKIRSKIEAGLWLPGDVMILLRRRGRFADLMVRALKELRIPVTGVDRMRLIRQLPVMDILALIQFVLLPQDDLNLACVLRGPLIGLSEDDLMGFAIGREGSLWESLTKNADGENFSPAHEYLAKLLAKADFVTPFQMISDILSQSCPASSVSGKHAIWARLGLDAIDPVDELLNAAQNFSRSRVPSLQNFLHWLTAAEAEIRRELDRRSGPEGQVRIMTVHASKGLEAPVVFLPDSASVPRVQDMPKFLWDGEEVPLFALRKPSNAAARDLWETARRRQMEEYRRLMYVALTRAANELYICGWKGVKAEPNADQSWYNLALNALRSLPETQQGLTALEAGAPQPEIIFADPLPLRAKDKATDIGKTISQLPAWVRQSPPPEETIQAVRASYTPSAATPDSNFTRGRIIHRLLQSLPDIAADKRAETARRFLSNPQQELSEVEQESVADEVLQLLNSSECAPLFAPDSRAEVPMAGNVNGKSLTGQVDRLCFNGDEIWIVDYKTNRPPPARMEDVPEAYRNQMADYRALLRQIYPDQTIRCFLLWTYQLRLMELPAAFLDGA